MAEPFDKVLDACIDHIALEGATVEECLARYPEHAAALEGELRAALKMTGTLRFTPSETAKEQGRARLRLEMRRIEQAEADRQRRERPLWLRVVRSRWALALASLIVLVFGGGPALVAASNSALPGDTLYPIKRAWEDTRLAFQFSDTGDAKLHAAFAQRRASELSQLIARGDQARIASSEKDLQDELRAVDNVIKDLDDEDAATVLAELSTRTSRALAVLQTALAAAPPEVKPAADSAFAAASLGFGQTVENVAARAPEPALPQAQGTLVMLITDPPKLKLEGVEQVLVQVQGIEAHRVQGKGGKWVTIASDPQTFDLLQVEDVQRFVAERQIDSGTYTKVRFQVTGAEVVTAEATFPARIASGALEIVRPFRVDPDKTTVALIDFDAQRSVKVIGKSEFELSPAVRVFADEPGQRPRPAREAQEKKGQPTRTPAAKTPQPEPTESPEKSPPPRPLEIPGLKPSTKIEIEGKVEAITDSLLVIKGRQITLSPDVKVKEPPRPGDLVRVDVVVGPDGSLTAAKIEPGPRLPPREKLKPTKENGDDRNGHGDRETPSPTAPARSPGPARTEPARPSRTPSPPPTLTPSPRPTAEQKTRIIVEGRIEQLGASLWVVGGRRVIISAGTSISGVPLLGAAVRVEGARQEDGTIMAENIVIAGAQTSPEKTPEPVPTPRPPTPPPLPATPPLPSPIPTPSL